MKKRIISTVFAAITSISAISSINAVALENPWGTVNTDEIFADYIKVDDEYALKYKLHGGTSDQISDVYLNADVQREDPSVIYVYKPVNRLHFDVSGITDISQYEEKLADISKDITFYYDKQNDGSYNCQIPATELTTDTVKKIRKLFGDTVTDFNYVINEISYYTSQPTLTQFFYCTDNGACPYASRNNCHITDIEETLDLVCDYIEENKLDVKVATKPTAQQDSKKLRGYLNVTPQGELTPLERYELASKICEITGLTPEYTIAQQAEESITGATLNLTTYLDGDANCDQKYTIADSTAILQALGNPDKYGLSDLGLFNADSTGDGLTVEDAVAIKIALAKGIE